MNRSLSVTAAIAALAAAGLVGCSTGKETPAAVSSSAVASSSTVTPAASTPSATTSSPSSSTAPTSTDSSSPASSSTESSSTATTSAAPMVGGMTECTKSALAEPATAAAQALGPDNLYAVDVLNCADGWAVTSGLLSSKDNPEMGAPTSFVFQQEGQFWVVQDKAKVCGTNPTTTTAPEDAAIPAALFVSGCAAG